MGSYDPSAYQTHHGGFNQTGGFGKKTFLREEPTIVERLLQTNELFRDKRKLSTAATSTTSEEPFLNIHMQARREK